MALRVYEKLDVAANRIKGPSTWFSITELPRVMLEVSSLAYTWPLLSTMPCGDHHPVLVLPGFTAGDESTLVLRRFLSRLKYRAMPWRLGQNTGSFELQDALIEHFDRVTRPLDCKVSIVGQSLGGVYARQLAQRFPERIRQIITLASPFASEGPESTNPLVAKLFRYMSGMSENEMREQMRNYQGQPPPVPSTAIYSKSDGVVHWRSCLEFEGEQAENVEIIGSHSGMALNPLVLNVIADRLAQPEGHWRPFKRNKGMRALFYPRPARNRSQSASVG
ncbi:MAG: alpha/beta hydrolase [Gammaproteobacteria bacterium]|nr:alpha/beta hydrolase [Gammaproteobacteria bacterium]